jgi:hypothetical protein
MEKYVQKNFSAAPSNFSLCFFIRNFPFLGGLKISLRMEKLVFGACLKMDIEILGRVTCCPTPLVSLFFNLFVCTF